MKKRDLARCIIDENIDLFRCPICKSEMFMQNDSLLCFNNHCFDLSKNGYINLLGRSIHSKYDKEMFTARNIITRSGFFRQMIGKESDVILKETNKRNLKKVRIIDAGCGEGSNIDGILKVLRHDFRNDFVGVGLDISREGIYIAAATYPGNIWCVGDLANSPFKDQQYDFILNILSPANYVEFRRILKNEGVLIKVIPGHYYLQEIREIFNQKKDKQRVAHENVMNLFQKHFTVLSREHLFYQQKIGQDHIVPLIRMTPLSWSIHREEFQDHQFFQLQHVTIDMTVIAGRKR